MDLDDVTASGTETFQYGDKVIQVLEAVNDDACLVVPLDSNCIGKVNKRNKKKKKKNITVNSLCVRSSRDLYVTDYKNKTLFVFPRQARSLQYLVQLHWNLGEFVNQLKKNFLSP